MCSISSPMVRMGRVLAFRTSCENKGLDFCDQESAEFANLLLNQGNQIILDRVRARLDSLELPEGTSVQACGNEPELYANRLQVVKFGDLVVNNGEREIRIGMSATVCKGNRKSKIWTRISTSGDAQDVNAASDVFDQLCELAKVVCDEMAVVYHEQLGAFLTSIGNSEKYDLETQHVFLMEAGDYESAKLFDTITTLRETANFFTVYDEGDWTPLGDLFEFANTRLSPAMEMKKLSFADEVTDQDIEEITDFFNAESKALTWDVTLGRHGLFAVDEMTSDPQTGSSRTHMVGICAGHIQPNPKAKPLSSSWLVSGNYAPRLGATF